MKLLISGVPDVIGQSFRRKAWKLSVSEGRKVTQGMLLERMFEKLYPNDIRTDEEQKEFEEADKLDIFGTEKDKEDQ